MSPEVGRACGAKRREGEGVAVLRRLRHGGACGANHHGGQVSGPSGSMRGHWR